MAEEQSQKTSPSKTVDPLVQVSQQILKAFDEVQAGLKTQVESSDAIQQILVKFNNQLEIAQGKRTPPLGEEAQKALDEFIRIKEALEPRALLFGVDKAFSKELDRKKISDALRQAFQDNHVPLSSQVEVDVTDEADLWLIMDVDNNRTFTIKREDNPEKLNVYSGRLWQLPLDPQR